MNEKEFQDKLGELIHQIDGLPADQRGEFEKLVEETRGRHDKMRKTISELQDALDYLRLSVKYLVFDLEATRRENEYLRKLIENQNRHHEGSDENSDDR